MPVINGTYVGGDPNAEYFAKALSDGAAALGAGLRQRKADNAQAAREKAVRDQGRYESDFKTLDAYAQDMYGKNGGYLAFEPTFIENGREVANPAYADNLKAVRAAGDAFARATGGSSDDYVRQFLSKNMPDPKQRDYFYAKFGLYPGSENPPKNGDDAGGNGTTKPSGIPAAFVGAKSGAPTVEAGVDAVTGAAPVRQTTPAGGGRFDVRPYAAGLGPTYEMPQGTSEFGSPLMIDQTPEARLVEAGLAQQAALNTAKANAERAAASAAPAAKVEATPGAPGRVSGAELQSWMEAWGAAQRDYQRLLNNGMKAGEARDIAARFNGIDPLLKQDDVAVFAARQQGTVPNRARGTGSPSMSPGELARHEARTGDIHIPALVGVKEGIVNARAMENGGDEIVRRLNASYPVFAPGTNGAVADGAAGSQGIMSSRPDGSLAPVTPVGPLPQDIEALLQLREYNLARAQAGLAPVGGLPAPMGDTPSYMDVPRDPNLVLEGPSSNDLVNPADSRFASGVGGNGPSSNDYDRGYAAAHPSMNQRPVNLDATGDMAGDTGVGVTGLRVPEVARGSREDSPLYDKAFERLRVPEETKATTTYLASLASAARAEGNIRKAEAVEVRLNRAAQAATRIAPSTFAQAVSEARNRTAAFLKTATDEQLAQYGFDEVLGARQKKRDYELEKEKLAEDLQNGVVTREYYAKMSANLGKSAALQDAQIREINSRIAENDAQSKAYLARAEALAKEGIDGTMLEVGMDIIKRFTKPEDLALFLKSNPSAFGALDEVAKAFGGQRWEALEEKQKTGIFAGIGRFFGGSSSEMVSVRPTMTGGQAAPAAPPPRSAGYSALSEKMGG